MRFPMPFPIDDILFPSGDICDQVAKSEISPKILMFLGRQFYGGGTPKFLTRFYKLQSPATMRQSLVTIGPETSGI